MERTDHEACHRNKENVEIDKICLSSLRCVIAFSCSNPELLRLLLRVLYGPIRSVRAVHTTASLLLYLGHTKAGDLNPSRVTRLPRRRADARC